MDNKRSPNAAENAPSSPVSFPFSYREVTHDKHVVRTDVLEQLKTNMARLEDLHGRLRFIMSEVRYLIKRG